ncbi:MAG: ribosome silencing factor [Acetobacter sp.]|nr:ribosome silencing factor [Acetobacter sp.]MCH4059938.1 ribosome silencing factor [Acetobacter sp.]MCH4086879.1 ribosome silencing factor [Acetobacter sp.]MCI1294301.1 ribosome silencing factor [Acetobacter sp.]MCI1320951.1 ribosome silencing factor [Acetobacter sp.]
MIRRRPAARYDSLTGETTIARKPPTETESKRRPATRAGAAASPRTSVTSQDVKLSAAASVPGSPRKKATVAGPQPEVKKRPHAPAERLEQYLKVITESIDDDKGEDIVVIDLTGRASFADRMVIATGLADRQISAMAQHLDRRLNDAGLKRVTIEGANGTDWVLIDAGDIVIHLFKAEARELYGLERMWGVELDETGDGPVTTL